MTQGPLILPLGERTPSVHPDAWVAPTAAVIGAATLAAGANVWYGAVVRADGDEIQVGRDTNVQDGAVLHADPGYPCHVGDQVTIGHGAVVHGARIGTGALIGMGARVLNGAVVGAHCLVAAGALLPEGFTAPERSLVMGAPAKVRRELTDEEVADLLQNAKEYTENARVHAAALNALAHRGSD